MKLVGDNYIDYSGEAYAIRVWCDSCHPMRRDNEKWISFDNLYLFPVPASALLSGGLAEVLADYENCDSSRDEKHELRRLLRGEIAFALAFGSATTPQSA